MRASHVPTAPDRTRADEDRTRPREDGPTREDAPPHEDTPRHEETRTSATRGRTRRRRLAAPTPLGRYRLQRQLGAGAFGTVWVAYDERLEREVAVKVLAPGRIVGGRFEREARAAARLAHPGIVTLYEASIDDDGAYLVSELVRGATLDDRLEAGQLSDRDVVRIAIVLCDALSHAHARGIVHRDVKPSNILVPEQPTSPAGVAKLTDFGVARVVGGDTLTRTGDVIGTAAYMAPEQAEGLEAGPAADLYSLALVVYEALTGINPVGASVVQRSRRLGAHLPPLRRQRRELPRELGCAIDLALRPRPRERGSIAELRRALVDSLPAMGDRPGIVVGPAERGWLASQPGLTGEEEAVPEQEAAAIDRRPWRKERSSDPARPWREEAPSDAANDGRLPASIPRPARALAALSAAAATGWLAAHILSWAPLAPAALALLAGVAVAALPRLGWLATLTVLAAAATIDGHPGAALIVALAGLLPVLLAPRSGVTWPVGAGAPALGLIGLAGAWPAAAGRLRGVWRRAVAGATGWVWLSLAAPLTGNDLYLRAPAGSGARDWMHSLQSTVDLVLKPIASSGAIYAAAVWAVAAVVLPWLIRGRSLAVDIVLAAMWAAIVVSATQAVIALGRPVAMLPTRAAVAGAVASALLALAPSLYRAARVGPTARLS